MIPHCIVWHGFHSNCSHYVQPYPIKWCDYTCMHSSQNTLLSKTTPTDAHFCLHTTVLPSTVCPTNPTGAVGLTSKEGLSESILSKRLEFKGAHMVSRSSGTHFSIGRCTEESPEESYHTPLYDTAFNNVCNHVFKMYYTMLQPISLRNNVL